MSREWATGFIISWKRSTGNQAAFQSKREHQDIDSRADAQQRDLIAAFVMLLLNADGQRYRQSSGAGISKPRVSDKINCGIKAEFIEHQLSMRGANLVA